MKQHVTEELLEFIIGTLALEKLLSSEKEVTLDLSITPQKVAGKAIRVTKDEKNQEIVVSITDEGKRTVEDEESFLSSIPVPIFPSTVLGVALIQAMVETGQTEVRFPESSITELLEGKRKLIPVVALHKLLVKIDQEKMV